ncbi:MAG TPA: imidazoleglycerol-phosphate dehydratase HisB [Candidatus Dormibacteraeota bacterium]|nr:imidazoleglycerol-phosphate dehydratase HisB [Candidatus Dormibacteraeota bacterium]
MPAERRSTRSRATRETRVTVSLDLDGRGLATVSTGVGFLDHMLTSVSIHSRFDLEVTAQGDLQVDAHHTVEDVALVLGEALDEALGDRRGIERFGHAVVPMDESLAAATVDCSGRSHASVEIGFVAGDVGGLPTSLLAHFFEALSRSGELTLHLTASGADNHHIAEASFKAVARALRQASRPDPSLHGRTPSAKGSL